VDGRADAAALEREPLLFGEPAPDARVLAAFQRPREAVVDDVAAPADGLGFLDLAYGGAGGPDREEKLRVFVTAGG